MCYGVVWCGTENTMQCSIAERKYIVVENTMQYTTVQLISLL